MMSVHFFRGTFLGLLAILPVFFVMFTGCGQGGKNPGKAEQTVIKGEEELLKGKASYNIKDYKAAVMSFSLSAELGNPEAMYRLGKCFLDGTGVERDTAEAIAFFCKAEEADYYMDAQMQFAIGELLFYDNDIEENESEAVKWYRKAAKQGHAEAQYKLGECYEFGDGVPQDYDEALKWYFKAPDNPSYVVKSVWIKGTRNWSPDDPDKRQAQIDCICSILNIERGKTQMFPRRGEGSDLPQMAEKLRREIPELEKVIIRRVLPDKLIFEIHERIPVAQLNAKLYIDDFGVVLDKAVCGDNIIDSLPILICKPSIARGSDDSSPFRRGETLSSTAICTALTFIHLANRGEFFENDSKSDSYISIEIKHIYITDHIQCSLYYNGDPREFIIQLPLNVTEKEFRSDYFGRLIPCLEDAVRDTSDIEHVIDLRYKDRVIIRPNGPAAGA